MQLSLEKILKGEIKVSYNLVEEFNELLCFLEYKKIEYTHSNCNSKNELIELALTNLRDFYYLVYQEKYLYFLSDKAFLVYSIENYYRPYLPIIKMKKFLPFIKIRKIDFGT